MSGHIDHAAEAARLLADLREGMLTHSGAPVDVQLAITHALLDVAEAVRAACDAMLSFTGTAQVVDQSEPLVTEGGAEVRPGDPDPTPDYPEGGFCGAQKPGGGSQTCTWSAGHEGAHVAGNGTIAVEVWS